MNIGNTEYPGVGSRTAAVNGKRVRNGGYDAGRWRGGDETPDGGGGSDLYMVELTDDRIVGLPVVLCRYTPGDERPWHTASRGLRIMSFSCGCVRRWIPVKDYIK